MFRSPRWPNGHAHQDRENDSINSPEPVAVADPPDIHPCDNLVELEILETLACAMKAQTYRRSLPVTAFYLRCTMWNSLEHPGRVCID